MNSRKGRGRRRIPGQMNKTESRYADHLAMRIKANELYAYAYEGLTLKLAHDTRFTPDFMVMNADDQIEFHEVKGTQKNKRPYIREDAHLKLRMAATMFPMFPFKVAFEVDGAWRIEEVKL